MMQRLFLFMMLISIVKLTTGCKNESTVISNSVKDGKIPVSLTLLKKETIKEPFLLSGIFTTENERYLSFKMGGIINAVLVKEGDVIKKGQILATLDPNDIQSQIQMAKIGLEKADRDLQRVKNLYRDSVATLEQFQNATTAFALAKEQFATATFNGQFSSITAPAGGYILKKLADVGQVVGPGSPIFLANDVAGNTAWVLKAGVTDIQWQALNIGENAIINFENGMSLPARIVRKSALVDPFSGTLTVELKPLSAGNISLASGMFGKAVIIPSKGMDVFRIPFSALLDANQNDGFIFITTDKKTVKKIKINISGFDKMGAWTHFNFEADTHLITEGGPYLTDGASIYEKP
jgi:RND family efflux transporter MFP subunit